MAVETVMSGVEEKKEEKQKCECVEGESEKCALCTTVVEQINLVTIEAPKSETYPIIIPATEPTMADVNTSTTVEQGVSATKPVEATAPEPVVEEVPRPPEKQPHYGQHSVTPTDVLQVNPLQCGALIGQDIIRVIAAHLETIDRRCTWRTPNFVCSFADMVSWYRPYMTPQDWPMTSSVYWMIPRADAHVQTNIVEVNPRVKGEFLPENYVGITQSGAPDLNSVMRTARGISGLSKQVAEKILHKVRENGKVTDLSGFFCCGHLFAAHLDFIAQANVREPAWNAIPADVLVTANIAAEQGQEVTDTVKNIEKHISGQLLAFKWDSLTPQDRQVLISIAMGGVSSVGVPAGLDVVPITSYITWPARQYFVWSEKAIELPAARERLTAEQVRCSMAAFATLLDAHDDHANGFTKCSTIIVAHSAQWDMPPDPVPEPAAPAPPRMPQSVRAYLERAGAYNQANIDDAMRDARRLLNIVQPTGEEPIPGLDGLRVLMAALNPPPAPRVVPPPRRVRGALIHALLEAKQIMVQQVRGPIFLWDVLLYKKPVTAIDRKLVDDGLALGGMDSDLQLRTCFFIGGMLSIAAGVVLHGINVTGRELNNYVAGGGDMISAQLRQWLQCTKSGGVAVFYQLLVGALQQMVSVKISPTFMARCSIWCGDRGEWEDIDQPNSWFRSEWARKIPYIIEPLSMSWVFLAFCDLWGYFGIRPRVNFSHDLVVGGAADQEYISFHRDEPRYMASASMKIPYRYIQYGIIMLNIMRQYFNAIGVWAISIRLIRVVKAGSGDLEPPIDNIFQPERLPNLPWYKAGTLLTFSHELQCVIVPGLTRLAINPDNFYILLRMGDVVLEGVGIQRDGIVGKDAAPIGGLALLEGLVGLDEDDTVPTVSKKAEN